MEADPVNLALYRKYRPATFAEVKGQDQVTVPLRQALLAGRVHHAYLFSGPRGCGKTSSARILARSLNCEQGPTPDPCGKCESCLALAPGGPGSIDVIEIDAASHGGVDDARDLRERAFYAPVSGRYKVYIIDEAHMVTREGFNALLKLVEEPPPHLKFVFATTEPEKVIGTIRSRTHHYPFRLVPPQILRELLEQILAAEGVGYDPAVLPLVVRAGAGSARDALSVLDQLLAGAGESGITYAATVSLLGYTDANLIDETVSAFAAGDRAAVFRLIDEVINAGHDPRRFGADLLDRFRDLIVLGAVADADRSGLLDVPADQLDRMREQVAKFGTAELTRAAEVLNAGLTEMRGAVSPRLLLELTCARVLLPAAESDDAALIARLERIERRLAAGDAGHSGDAPGGGHGGQGGDAGQGDDAASAPQQARAAASRPKRESARAGQEQARTPRNQEPAGDPGDPGDPGGPVARPLQPSATPAQASPGVLDAEALRHDWPAILDAVRQIRKVSWIQLSNATVASLEGNVLSLEFARDGDLKGFTASRSDALLAKVLHDRFGVDWRIQGVAAISRGRSAPSGLVPGGQDQVTARVPEPQRRAAPARREDARTARREGTDPHGETTDPPGAARQAPSAAQHAPTAARGAEAQHPPAPARQGPGARGSREPAAGASPGDPEGQQGFPAAPAEPDFDAYDELDDEPAPGPAISGMELIRRELGGQIIGEVDAAGGTIGPAAG